MFALNVEKKRRFNVQYLWVRIKNVSIDLFLFIAISNDG